MLTNNQKFTLMQKHMKTMEENYNHIMGPLHRYGTPTRPVEGPTKLKHGTLNMVRVVELVLVISNFDFWFMLILWPTTFSQNITFLLNIRTSKISKIQ